MKIKHLITIAAIALSSTLASPAFAHAKLESAAPAANSTVAVPTVLRLQFNEPLELPFSKVILVDASGATLTPTSLALDEGNNKALVAALPKLNAGAYSVQWTATTRDGHKVKGQYSFQAK